MSNFSNSGSVFPLDDDIHIQQKSDTSVVLQMGKPHPDIMSEVQIFEGTLGEMDQITLDYQNKLARVIEKNKHLPNNPWEKRNSQESQISQRSNPSQGCHSIGSNPSPALYKPQFNEFRPHEYVKMWNQNVEMALIWYEHVFYERIHKEFSKPFRKSVPEWCQFSNRSNPSAKFPAVEHFSEWTKKMEPFPSSWLDELHNQQKELNGFSKTCSEIIISLQPKIQMLISQHFPARVQILTRYMKELENCRLNFYKTIHLGVKQFVQSGVKCVHALIIHGNSLLQKMKYGMVQQIDQWKSKEQWIAKQFSNHEQTMQKKSQQMIQKCELVMQMCVFDENDPLRLVFETYKKRMIRNGYFDGTILNDFKNFVCEWRNTSPKNGILIDQLHKQLLQCKKLSHEKLEQLSQENSKKQSCIDDLKKIRIRVQSIQDYLNRIQESPQDSHNQILHKIAELEEQTRVYAQEWEGTLGKKEKMVSTIRHEYIQTIQSFISQIYGDFESVLQTLRQNYSKQEIQFRTEQQNITNTVRKQFCFCFDEIQKEVVWIKNSFPNSEICIEKTFQFISIEKIMDRMSKKLNTLSLLYHIRNSTKEICSRIKIIDI